MAQCIKCGNLLREGAKFCAKCGTKQDSATIPVAETVAAGDGPATATRLEAPATVSAQPERSTAAAQPERATVAAQPERCPACGKAAVPGAPTCWACGAKLSSTPSERVAVTALEPEPVPWQPPLPPVEVPEGKASQQKLLVVIGSVATLCVVAFLWWWLAGATMRKFSGALERGRLVGVDGQSAYELYSQALREKGPGSTTVQSMKDKARPVVEKRVLELFQNWYRESDLGEGVRWADLQKLSAWLAEIYPSNNDVLGRAKFAQAQMEQLANHFAESEQIFRAALNYIPNWSMALNGIGRACRNEHNYQCAEEYYKRAIQADPQWIFPHQNLAGLYMEQTRLSESEAEYQTAVRLNPNRPGSRFLLGQLYDRKRQPAEACNEYRTALSLAANQTRSSFDRDFVNRRLQKVCK